MSAFDKQLQKVKNDKGFIAALDQSGGSTPKALKLYGVNEDAWTNEQGMYDVVHQMRSRIITSPARPVNRQHAGHAVQGVHRDPAVVRDRGDPAEGGSSARLEQRVL